MKTILIVFFILLRSITFSQDTSRIKEIDSLVKAINQSDLITETDSVIQDMPAMGLYMKTYLSLSVKDSIFTRYSNNVTANSLENGVSLKSNTSSVFYFYNSQLIKVEESGIMKGKSINFFWYYFDNKPYYYTFKSDRSEDRALQLLEISKNIYNKIKPKK